MTGACGIWVCLLVSSHVPGAPLNVTACKAWPQNLQTPELGDELYLHQAIIATALLRAGPVQPLWQAETPPATDSEQADLVLSTCSRGLCWKLDPTDACAPPCSAGMR